MTITEKINFIKTEPNHIFFFKEEDSYRLYNENAYWFYKKLQPIKVNRSSIKYSSSFYLYFSFPIDKLIYIKNEYPSAFNNIKIHKFGFSTEVSFDISGYAKWSNCY